VNIAGFAVAPSGHRLLGKAHNVLGVALQPGASKGRCGEATLPAPQSSFTGEEALAEYGTDLLLEQPMLDEAIPLTDENRFDVIGVAQQKHRPDAEAEGHDVTILTQASVHEAESIPSDAQRVAQQRKALGPPRPTGG
jgi:hypothetical protein